MEKCELVCKATIGTMMIGAVITLQIFNGFIDGKVGVPPLKPETRVEWILLLAFFPLTVPIIIVPYYIGYKLGKR